VREARAPKYNRATNNMSEAMHEDGGQLVVHSDQSDGALVTTANEKSKQIQVDSESLSGRVHVTERSK
jgi:hypothetical protein